MANLVSTCCVVGFVLGCVRAGTSLLDCSLPPLPPLPSSSADLPILGDSRGWGTS